MSSEIKPDITAWLDNAGRFPLLPPERINMICRQIQSLPERSPKRRHLINKIVTSNLLLVVRFVKQYMKTSHNKWGSSETVDYLQAGCVGLIRAAEKYDHTRGYAFSTYANHWIRSEVGRYSLKTLTPVYVSENVTRQIMFYNRNGFMKAKYDNRKLSTEQAEEVKARAAVAYSCLSLDVSNDKGSSLVESLVDKGNVNTLESIGTDLYEAMQRSGINAIGQQVLVRLYVYDETCRQISKDLGLPYERIKREKKAALELAKQHHEFFESGTL
jgi:RNA polymerase sigma factor (sigma-70 family)